MAFLSGKHASQRTSFALGHKSACRAHCDEEVGGGPTQRLRASCSHVGFLGEVDGRSGPPPAPTERRAEPDRRDDDTTPDQGYMLWFGSTERQIDMVLGGQVEEVRAHRAMVERRLCESEQRFSDANKSIDMFMGITEHIDAIVKSTQRDVPWMQARMRADLTHDDEGAGTATMSERFRREVSDARVNVGPRPEDAFTKSVDRLASICASVQRAARARSRQARKTQEAKEAEIPTSAARRASRARLDRDKTQAGTKQRESRSGHEQHRTTQSKALRSATMPVGLC